MNPMNHSDAGWAGELMGNLTLRGLLGGLADAWQIKPAEGAVYTRRDFHSRLLLGHAGCLGVRLNDQEIGLEPGQLILVPAETHVVFSFKGGSSFFWLYFHATYAGCINLFRFFKVNQFRVAFADEAKFAEMLEKFSSPRACDQLAAVSLLTSFLVLFIEHATSSETERPTQLQRLIPVLQHIEDHLAEPIDIETLARLLSVTPRYFANLFSSRMGVPLLQYVTHRRIQRAKDEMLIYPDRSVKEIAILLGFEDPFYFARVFRKNSGQSPTEYRRRHPCL